MGLGKLLKIKVKEEGQYQAADFTQPQWFDETGMRELAKNSSKALNAAVMAFVQAMNDRAAQWRQWQQQEAWWNEKRIQYEKASVPFGNAMWEAGDLNNKMEMKAAGLKFAEAVSLGKPLAGLLQGLAADNKLSEKRKKIFCRPSGRNKTENFQCRTNGQKLCQRTFEKRK